VILQTEKALSLNSAVFRLLSFKSRIPLQHYSPVQIWVVHFWLSL